MRLRPILMTSLAMMFGALPLALSLGAASKSRMPLGIVIVGGLLFSLLLSLFIVPVIYTFFSRRKPQSVTAVSYTHLDVYKRQSIQHADSQGACSGILCNKHVPKHQFTE